MRRWLRTTVFILCGVLLGLAVALFLIYRASQDVPEFYEQALHANAKSQEEASDEMLKRAAALASDVSREGEWQAVFTAEQVNGWLAVDMVENYPGLLPSSLSDPRVAITPEQLWVAYRYKRGDWTSVLSLAVDVYLAEPNVVALRIRAARAGLLPVPLKTVVDRISRKADQLDLTIRWRQADGDPVAEVSIPPPRDANDKVVRIETVRLGEGEIYISGTTERRQPETAPKPTE